MAKIKKAQKGGCLSTTGSGTRTSIYKSAAGEGGSGKADGKAARQFARAERKMDKAQAKMDREEAAAKAKAPKGKSGLKVKKAQDGKALRNTKDDAKNRKQSSVLTEMGKKTTKAAIDKRTDDMAKSLNKASAFGKNYIPSGDSAKKTAKNPVPKKKMKNGGKAKKMMSGGKCKYGC